MEFHHIVPHDGDMDEVDRNEDNPSSPDLPIWSEVVTLLCVWFLPCYILSEVYVFNFINDLWLTRALRLLHPFTTVTLSSYH